MRLRDFLHRRNGRRRTLLGLIGVVWLMQSWVIFHSPLPGWQWGRLGPGPIEEVLMDPRSGLVWAVSGLVGVVTAVLPRRRVPDAYGFNALLIPPLLWMVLSAWSWLIWVVTRGAWGSPESWVMAVVWSCAVIFVLITSGWPDPRDEDR